VQWILRVENGIDSRRHPLRANRYVLIFGKAAIGANN
jgi:hypothetical protein